MKTKKKATKRRITRINPSELHECELMDIRVTTHNGNYFADHYEIEELRLRHEAEDTFLKCL